MPFIVKCDRGFNAGDNLIVTHEYEWREKLRIDIMIYIFVKY